MVRPAKRRALSPTSSRPIAADSGAEISSALQAFIAANATKRFDMQLALPWRGRPDVQRGKAPGRRCNGHDVRQL
ncbi:hypothetical protein DXU04_40955 [Bradyrhizobium diazoefficiens]